MKNSNNNASLQDLLQGVSYLINTVDRLSASVTAIENELHCGGIHWMSVDQLVSYIPTHPSKQTLYQWVRYGKIPYHRMQGSLIFLKDEVDQWLLHNGQMDACESAI